jgi:type IX secretion system PorP/SprF family membrane protein
MCKCNEREKCNNLTMKKNSFLISISAYLLISTSSLFSQDVHFSQSNMTPLLLNPALTGVEGDQRAFLNYKNQWRGLAIQGAAFNTALFSFDAALLKNKWRKGYLGAGIVCYRDVAGDLKMGTTQLNISIAGIVYVNENQFLSGGLQAGYVQKSISSAAMQWENQYDGSSGTYNAALPSNDIASLPPLTYGNFSTGLAWTYHKDQRNVLSSNEQLKINLGVALQNVNTPKQNFADYGISNQLYSKYVIHGTAMIGIQNTNFALMPNVVYYKQGPLSELNIGTLFRYSIKDKSKYTGVYKGCAISMGAQYRLKDAVAPVVLFEYSSYSIGMSYDVNVSGLTSATGGKGGFEISLKYVNPNPFHSAPRLRGE